MLIDQASIYLVLSKIVGNMVVLFAVAYIYVVTSLYVKKKTIIGQIVCGMVIFIAAALLMLNAYVVKPGLLLDTRSILYVISGLFFGPIPTIVSVLLGVSFRIFYIGGAGMFSGCLIIVTSAAIGMAWSSLIKKKKMNRFLSFYLLGLNVQIFTLIDYLLLMFSYSLSTIGLISIPTIVVFPVLTLVACLPFSFQKDWMRNGKTDIQKDFLIDANLDMPRKIAICSLGKDYKYLSFNARYAENMKSKFGADIKYGSNYFDYIRDAEIQKTIKSNIDSIFCGNKPIYSQHFEKETNQYFEDQYLPLKNQRGDVVGTTIFSQDITEQHKSNEQMMSNCYIDVLTGFYNRRYLQEKIENFSNTKILPLSIIFADINDLKLVNDVYGHTAGDNLLLQATKTMTETITCPSTFFRIGGDEFVISLPNTNKQNAEEIVKRLTNELGKKTIADIPISVAFGLATTDSCANVDDFMRIAEKDMYEAKFQGVHQRQNFIVQSIVKMFFANHPEESSHGERVAEISEKIARKIGIVPSEIPSLKNLARLHDIGCVGLDLDLQDTPNKWDTNDKTIIMRHVEIGYHILSVSTEYSDIAIDVLSHHERFDGTGFPCGLAGEIIPLRARILSVANFYDAATVMHKDGTKLTKEQAVDELKKASGSKFDPKIVEAFVGLFKENQI